MKKKKKNHKQQPLIKKGNFAKDTTTTIQRSRTNLLKLSDTGFIFNLKNKKFGTVKKDAPFSFLRTCLLGLKRLEFKQGKCSQKSFSYFKNTVKLQLKTVKDTILSNINFSSDEIFSLERDLPSYSVLKKIDDFFLCNYTSGLTLLNAIDTNSLYSSNNKDPSSTVILIHSPDSKNKASLYGVVYSLRAYMLTRNYLCPKCNKISNKKSSHICKTTHCKKCFTALSLHAPLKKLMKEKKLITLFCENCNRIFSNLDCFRLHKKSICKNSLFCGCGVPVKFKDVFCHTCNLTKTCPTCKELVDPFKNVHQTCFIKPVALPKKPNFKKYVFFDFESLVVKNDEHIVNFYCAQIYSVVNFHKKVFEFEDYYFGLNALDIFLQRLVFHTDFKNTCYIAHCGSKYDNLLILFRLVNKMGIIPRVVMKGNKVNSIRLHEKRIFLDSYCFAPIALSQFPQTFDFQCDTKKGIFPYLFNTVENTHYVGHLPKRKYFGYQNMTKIQRVNFNEWYFNRKKEGPFSLEKEITEYCRMDVKILAKGMLKMSETLFDMTGCELFSAQSCTISSIAMKIFRSQFMPEKTILNIGDVRPNSNISFSKSACELFDYMNFIQYFGEEKIIHAQNSPSEVRIGRFFVDGIIPSKKIIIEYNQCLLHGHVCKSTEKLPRDVPLSPWGQPLTLIKRKSKKNHAISFSSLNTRLQIQNFKVQWLSKVGFEVKTFWSCEKESFILKTFQQQRGSASRMGKILPLTIDRISPRESYFGGRTECFLRYASFENNVQDLMYEDIISLYPSILLCKNEEFFPVGEYEVIRPGIDCGYVNAKQLVENFNGLAKVTILPPRDLLIPVLPYRTKQKTIFALCRTCVESFEISTSWSSARTSVTCCPYHVSVCSHNSIRERAFLGCWIIPEIKLAIEKGYKILQIHEILHFRKRSQTLFKKFVHTFFKAKVEASGFPVNIETEEEKTEYIRKIWEQDEIQLDKEKIKNNAGMRVTSKLVMNSLYGKFAQTKYREVKFIQGDSMLQSILLDSQNIVHFIRKTNENEGYMVQLEKISSEDSRKDQLYSAPNFVNVIIASFVSAFGRIRLYRKMDTIHPMKILFCDTDSTCFVKNYEETSKLVGPAIGDFTDEICKIGGKDAKLEEVVVMGPKQYILRIKQKDGNVLEKVALRGITWNRNSERNINFQKMKKIIEDEHRIRFTEDEKTVKEKLKIMITFPNQIKRDGKQYKILTLDQHKLYSPVHDKRVVIQNSFYSYPYGYNNPSLSCCNKL